MKRIFTAANLVMSLTILSFVGCSERPEENGYEDRVAISVGANINETKVSDAQWNDNDLIGITMFDAGTTNLAEGNFRNNKYVFRSGSTGAFDALNENSVIYFPKNGSNVDFLTYYPHNAQIGSSYVMPIDVSNQTVLPAIDFMTANHTAGHSKADASVKFQFHHKLSKVIIVLQTQAGDDPVRLIGSQIKINGMLTKATYDLLGANSLIAADPNSAAELSFPSDLSGANAKGIVLPRRAGTGVVFNVKLTDGSTYVGNMDETLELESGFQYLFYLSLRKTAIDVSATVQPWLDSPRVDLTAISVTTPVNASVNIKENDEMKVYNGSSLLTSFTYSSGAWTTLYPYYWESLTGASADFKASITPVAALNTSQLPDILVADPITVARNNGINFTIRHAATKVTAVLASSDGSFNATELGSATIKLPNYTGGGAEVNGLFVAGSSVGNVTLTNGVAIFQPQAISGGSDLAVVTINGKDYFIKAPVGGVDFKKGEARVLNIDMKKTGISVSATVVDWVTGSAINLNGRFVSITVPGNTTGFVASDVIDFFILNNSVNTKFTYQVDQTWVPSPKIYWDNLTTIPINVAAVFPDVNRTSNGNIYSWYVDVDQHLGLKNSDLLVAYSAGLVGGASANLSFKHAMNKVNVVLVGGTGFAAGELDNATVVITNLYARCDVNLTNLAVTNLSDRVDIIPFKTSNLNYSALVAPCTITNGTKVLEITVAGITYPVPLAADMNFEATKYNTLTVTINKTAIGISCNIESWSIGTNGSYIIQ